MQREHQRILTDLLSLPTAPFAEHHVIDYVREFCRRRPALSLAQDRSGNLLIRFGPRKRRPIVLAAHMDHPGFIVQTSLAPSRPLRGAGRVSFSPGDSSCAGGGRGGRASRPAGGGQDACASKGVTLSPKTTPRDVNIGRHLVRAKWYGGVRPEYFAGAPVRFFDGGKWVRGRVVRVECGPDGKAPRVSHVEAVLAQPVPAGAVGMWDLDGPVVRRGRLFARGCDDVAGVAATLACLDELVRHRSRGSLHVLLTRAEEVGFVGAIAACRNRTISPDAVVVSIECSSELPGAKMGDGPILRVGDLATTFSPAATAWCRAVAERLAASSPSFVFQRKLMDGGTCEATAYGEFGYDATGLCIALGNYHNMDCARKRLAPEYIDPADWEGLVRWFVALATTELRCDGRHAGLRKRLRNLERIYREDLQAGLGSRMSP